MNALAEFKDYYKHLDEIIAESTGADLARWACYQHDFNCPVYSSFLDSHKIRCKSTDRPEGWPVRG